MARLLSLDEVLKGKIPALRFEKYNPSATLLSHCNDYCHNSASWGRGKKVCLKYGVKPMRIFITTYFAVYFQLMINTKDVKTQRLVGRMRPGSSFYTLLSLIRHSSHCMWRGSVPKKCSSLSWTCSFHHEPEGWQRSVIPGWQRTTNVSRQCQNKRSFKFQWL